VAAIIVFILIALGFILGIGSGDSPGLHNLTTNGGFAPEGVIKILAGVVIVIFAFIGAEIVTIAAGESDEPEKSVIRATRQVVARVLTFYVAAVFLVICVVPWNTVVAGESPFIAALDRIGIPGSADIMNAIIVTAVLSCLNSGIYVASRMLFALARRGDAPKALLETSPRGVPVKAILLSVTIGFISVIFNAISPDKVFLFLVNSSGAVALFCYILIALAELRMRRRLEQEAPERLKVKMWPVADLRRDRRHGHRHRVDGPRRGRALAAHPEPHLARRGAGRGLRAPSRDRAPPADGRPGAVAGVATARGTGRSPSGDAWAPRIPGRPPRRRRGPGG
jgi:GABA permease